MKKVQQIAIVVPLFFLFESALSAATLAEQLVVSNIAVAPSESGNNVNGGAKKRPHKKQKKTRRKRIKIPSDNLVSPNSPEEGELVDCEYCGNIHDLDEICQIYCGACEEFHEEDKCPLGSKNGSGNRESEQLPGGGVHVLQASVGDQRGGIGFGIGFFCEVCHKALEVPCRYHLPPRLILDVRRGLDDSGERKGC